MKISLIINPENDDVKLILLVSKLQKNHYIHISNNSSKVLLNDLPNLIIFTKEATIKEIDLVKKKGIMTGLWIGENELVQKDKKFDYLHLSEEYDFLFGIKEHNFIRNYFSVNNDKELIHLL